MEVENKVVVGFLTYPNILKVVELISVSLGLT